MSNPILTLSIFALYFSVIALWIVSFFTYNFFTDEILFTKCNFNRPLLSLITAGSAPIIFGLLFLFIEDTKSTANYVITFPSYLTLLFLFWYNTTTSSLDRCMSRYSSDWSVGVLVNEKPFEFVYHCCGWENYTDRGVAVCPFDYESGCLKIIKSYLSPRMEEINSSIVTIMYIAGISFALSMIIFISTSSYSIVDEMGI